jgi:hypothetical protein
MRGERRPRKRNQAVSQGSPYKSGRSAYWVKVKNPKAPGVTREAEDYRNPSEHRGRATARQPRYSSRDSNRRSRTTSRSTSAAV